jgi:hypothetical protein
LEDPPDRCETVIGPLAVETLERIHSLSDATATASATWSEFMRWQSSH